MESFECVARQWYASRLAEIEGIIFEQTAAKDAADFVELFLRRKLVLQSLLETRIFEIGDKSYICILQTLLIDLGTPSRLTHHFFKQPSWKAVLKSEDENVYCCPTEWALTEVRSSDHRLKDHAALSSVGYIMMENP